MQTKDIPATILDLANIPVPDCFKGKSLLTYEGNSSALLEYMGGGCPDLKRRPINIGIRTNEYFVIMDVSINLDFSQAKLKEVYDEIKDPREHNNLANKKNIKKEIKKEIELIKKRYDELKKQIS